MADKDDLVDLKIKYGILEKRLEHIETTAVDHMENADKQRTEIIEWLKKLEKDIQTLGVTMQDKIISCAVNLRKELEHHMNDKYATKIHLEHNRSDYRVMRNAAIFFCALLTAVVTIIEILGYIKHFGTG